MMRSETGSHSRKHWRGHFIVLSESFNINISWRVGGSIRSAATAIIYSTFGVGSIDRHAKERNWKLQKAHFCVSSSIFHVMWVKWVLQPLKCLQYSETNEYLHQDWYGKSLEIFHDVTNTTKGFDWEIKDFPMKFRREVTSLLSFWCFIDNTVIW